MDGHTRAPVSLSSANGRGRGPSTDDGAASPFVDSQGFFDLGAATRVGGGRGVTGLGGLQVGQHRSGLG